MGEDPFADEAVRENLPVAGEAWERRSSSARCGKLGCIYTRGLLDVKREFCGSGCRPSEGGRENQGERFRPTGVP